MPPGRIGSGGQEADHGGAALRGFVRLAQPAAALPPRGRVEPDRAGPFSPEPVLPWHTGVEVKLVDLVEGLEDGGRRRPLRPEAGEEAAAEARTSLSVVDEPLRVVSLVWADGTGSAGQHLPRAEPPVWSKQPTVVQGMANALADEQFPLGLCGKEDAEVDVVADPNRTRVMRGRWGRGAGGPSDRRGPR
jgi:hypothetical protein